MANPDDVKHCPSVILILSGKRKSGKDYISDILQGIFGHDRCFLIQVAYPIKEHYAKENNLELEKLMDGSSPYKEIYRKAMVDWGVQQRDKDPGIFCRLASQRPGNDRPIWMLTDARRESDLRYFNDNFGRDRIVTIRVVADENVRRSRGWCFTEGIDDETTECGLDHYVFDHVIENNGTSGEVQARCGELVDNHVAKLLDKFKCGES